MNEEQVKSTTSKEAKAPVVENKEEPKVETPAVKPTSKTLQLADKSEVIVTRLKAGKYYKSQKVYSEWIQDMFSALESTKENPEGVDTSKFVDGKGKPDEKKIEAELKKADTSSFKRLISVTSGASGYKLELASISLDKTIEEIEEDYYPEDIERIVQAIIDLNDFISNLKNSVAPMSGLGAK